MFFKVGRVFKNFTNFPAALLKRDSKPGVYLNDFFKSNLFNRTLPMAASEYSFPSYFPSWNLELLSVATVYNVTYRINELC